MAVSCRSMDSEVTVMKISDETVLLAASFAKSASLEGVAAGCHSRRAGAVDGVPRSRRVRNSSDKGWWTWRLCEC